MADYQHHEQKTDEPREAAPAPVKIEEIDQPVETTDRGLFGFFGKKKDENKCEEDAIASEFDHKVQVSDDKKEEPKFEAYEEKKEEPKFEACEEKKEEPRFEAYQEKKEEPKGEEKKHESLLEKLHRSSSSSSSSSDEEVEEGGEKKKKKKGLKDKVKEKVTGDKKEEAEETSVPVEKCDEIHTPKPDEKKGFLDKIKEKLPGGKKTEEEYAAPPPPKEEVVDCATAPEAEGKEKKGFLDKIKEKIPGYHHKGEEEKEKEKGAEAAHH